MQGALAVIVRKEAGVAVVAALDDMLRETNEIEASTTGQD
jgi:hypothetical protein